MSRLTVVSRERLIRRHLDEQIPLRTLAAHAGISLRTAYKWLARTALVEQRHWWIDGACDAASGGRSIRCFCSRRSLYGISDARSDASLACSRCPSPRWAGP